MSQNPIQMMQGDDGVFTVSYFAKTVGWIQPAKETGRRVKIYRALTVNNDLKHFYGMDAARCWLISNYA